MLKAGKPEALKVTVGTTVAPQVGPAGKVTTVSLLPADLLKGPRGARRRRRRLRPRPGAAPRPRAGAQRRAPAAAARTADAAQ